MTKRAYRALLAEQHEKDREELRRAEGNSALQTSMRELFALRDQIYRESRVVGPVRRLARATAEAAEALRAGDALVARRKASAARALTEHQAFLREGVRKAEESEKRLQALRAPRPPPPPLPAHPLPPLPALPPPPLPAGPPPAAPAPKQEHKYPKPPKSLEEALIAVNNSKKSNAVKRENRAKVKKEYAEKYGVTSYDREDAANRSKGRTAAEETRQGLGGALAPAMSHDHYMRLLELALTRSHAASHAPPGGAPVIHHYH